MNPSLLGQYVGLLHYKYHLETTDMDENNQHG